MPAFPEDAPEHVKLRPYAAADEAAAIALWQRTWQQAYPNLDFAARVDWWRERWKNELVPTATIVIAERNGAIAGFVTVDATGYLDQIVVAPEAWGSNVARHVDRRSQAYFAGRPRFAGQPGQRACHPLLREAGFCDHRRRDEPALGRAVASYELATGLSHAQKAELPALMMPMRDHVCPWMPSRACPRWGIHGHTWRKFLSASFDFRISPADAHCKRVRVTHRCVCIHWTRDNLQKRAIVCADQTNSLRSFDRIKRPHAGAARAHAISNCSRARRA